MFGILRSIYFLSHHQEKSSGQSNDQCQCFQNVFGKLYILILIVKISNCPGGVTDVSALTKQCKRQIGLQNMTGRCSCQILTHHSTRDQWCFFRCNISQVTPEIIYFHYLYFFPGSKYPKTFLSSFVKGSAACDHNRYGHCRCTTVFYLQINLHHSTNAVVFCDVYCYRP